MHAIDPNQVACDPFQVCGDAHENPWSTWHVLRGLECAVLSELNTSQDDTVKMRLAR